LGFHTPFHLFAIAVELDSKLSKDNKNHMEWDGAENICLDYLENLYNALHNDKISTIPERSTWHSQQAALSNDSFSEKAISIVSHPVTPTMQFPEEQIMVYPRDKDDEEIITSADEVHTKYAKVRSVQSQVFNILIIKKSE
jgi:hypothetical protein